MNYWWIIRSSILLAVVVISSVFVCHYALLFIKKWLVNWRLSTVCFENPPTKKFDLPPNLSETLYSAFLNFSTSLPRSYAIQY